MAFLVTVAVLALLAIIILARSVKIIPQARAGIVERLGRYARSLGPGLSVIVPFIDNVRYTIDLREQVVSFPPQNVITEDNLVVAIDTVIYFQVTDPVRATYEIANYIQAIEQLTQTTLRNIVGGMDLERALTSREEINTALGTILDEATGKWGVKVNRVELKGIDPPPSIQDSMEKQMRADRDKRAAVLTAEGVRQSAILTAEGEKQAAILSAEGERQSQILRAQAQREAQILRAQGEAQAIETVFNAIHDGQPDQALLSYQYLQMLPQIAQGDSNKLWIVPSEIGKALEGIGSMVGKFGEQVPLTTPPSEDGRARAARSQVKAIAEAEEQTGEALQSAEDEVATAIAAAEDAAKGGLGTSRGSTDGGRALGKGVPTKSAGTQQGAEDTSPE
ncbi:SPFH domain-containing protein [Actinopolymorpha alba]|uniref:SPFH domain-containing protein n=1 Tax=Actinopolymorpha alba TaxID=533267 RepID=UPI0012F6AA12|nr:SPFH domain-containing protein [Actinopolymorpha alba]